MRSERFRGQFIELTGRRIAGDRSVETFGIEDLEPGTKPRQLGCGELFNGLSDVFCSGHDGGKSIMDARDCQRRPENGDSAGSSGELMSVSPLPCWVTLASKDSVTLAAGLNAMPARAR